MTTIVYRAGIMASDSAVWQDDIQVYQAKKIFRLKNGGLVGVAGRMETGLKIRDWLNLPEPDEPMPPTGTHTYIMYVRPNGKVTLFDDSAVVQAMDRWGYYAIGSGQAVALGALHAKATAREAVAAAIEHSSGSRPPVHWLKL